MLSTLTNHIDLMSIRILHICGDHLLASLDSIFRNIILTGIYPGPWKLANVTLVHKKDDKQLTKNYRPISLCQYTLSYSKEYYVMMYTIILSLTIILPIINQDSNQVTLRLISYYILSIISYPELKPP